MSEDARPDVETPDPDEARAEAMIALSDPLRDTVAQIAEECGLRPAQAAYLAKVLDRKFLPLKRALDEIGNDEMSKLFRYRSWQILEGVSQKDIDEASLRDKMVSAAIATDKSLLLAGQPTQILSVEQLRNLDALAGMMMEEMQRRGFAANVNEGDQTVTVSDQGIVGDRKFDASTRWPTPGDEP